MEQRIILDFFGGHEMIRKQNLFMHTADVFEAGKQLAIHERIIVDGVDVKLDKLCENYAKAVIEAGGHAVFVGIRTINGIKPETRINWFRERTQSISIPEDGDLKWGTFKDLLTQLGYEAKTDQNMHVIEVL